jgi:hypothetical protein
MKCRIPLQIANAGAAVNSTSELGSGRSIFSSQPFDIADDLLQQTSTVSSPAMVRTHPRRCPCDTCPV